MRPPWKTQTASDIIRNGLGYELLDADANIVIEVFRSDADRTVTVSVLDDSVPQDVIDELITEARRGLGTFEDGTPLPDEFLVDPPE